MARDTADDPTERSLLDRRKYLKLAGVAAASLGSAAAAAGGASAARERVNVVDAGADPTGSDPIDGVLRNVVDDGVEVYFPSGTYRIDSVTLRASNYALVGDDATIVPGNEGAVMLHLAGSDWTFDGFEIDNTVTGEMPRHWVRSSGTDWTVRNVDVTGKARRGIRMFFGSVRDPDATGRYENVTATDGSARGTNAKTTASVGAFYVSQHHVGTLTLDNVDIRNFWSRGIYHSGVSTGAIRVVDSYWENNRVNIRLAGKDCVVRNTTVKQTVNKPGPSYCVWLRANRESPSSKVHAQAHNALIEGCTFVVDGTDSSNPPHQASAVSTNAGSNGYFGSFTVRDCDIRIEGANATAGVEAGPQSFPTGTSGSPPEGVTVENTTIATDGSTNGVTIEGRDDCVVRSSCIDAGGRTLDFSNASVDTGDISRGSCSSFVGETPTTPEDDTPRTVTISGGGGSNLVEYRLSVDGELERSTAGGATIDDEDSVSGSVAEGGVAGGLDAYEFSGELTGFEADGDVTLTVDGEEVDPDSFPAVESELPNLLVVDGGSRSTLATYEFEVSGEVEKDAEHGTVNPYDEAADGAISGRVIGGKDAFRFSGEITGFRVDGSATVSLNSD